MTLPELNLGGGFGIAYTPRGDPADPAQLATEMSEVVARACRALGIPVPRLVDRARPRDRRTRRLCTVYTVGTVKPVDLDGGAGAHLRLVDGGMSDNIRPALYGADYHAHARRALLATPPPVLARVVGKHCESGDIVVKAEFLPGDVRAGRPAGGAGDRRLLPLDGLQLQPRAPAAGGRRAGRRRARPRAPGDSRTTCWRRTGADPPGTAQIMEGESTTPS